MNVKKVFLKVVVKWLSKKNLTVSNAEAEYVARSEDSKQIVSLRIALLELK